MLTGVTLIQRSNQAIRSDTSKRQRGYDPKEPAATEQRPVEAVNLPNASKFFKEPL